MLTSTWPKETLYHPSYQVPDTVQDTIEDVAAAAVAASPLEHTTSTLL